MELDDRSHYADRLREAAALLVAQGANPFRAAAYRNAADTIMGLTEDVTTIIDRDGAAGLERIPGVGRGISAALMEMARTGRWTLLERLRGTSDPVELFTTVPGLGHRLAEHIHEELHIDTLEALEIAAHDGRLEDVTGVGPRRAAAIRANLHAVLSMGRPRRALGGGSGGAVEPEVATLLEVDREYRDRAARGELQTIAPRRFNPNSAAWLPVLHSMRDERHFTALFSNTAQAHQLGRTSDWVVIYFYDDEGAEGQCTVVTETHGPLAGHRVVRGREAECRAHYAR
jgi:DNA polymerase (family 10)